MFACYLWSYSLYCSFSQGLSVMLVFTVFNSEVKEAWSVACLGKKIPGEDPPRPPQNTVSHTQTRFQLSTNLKLLNVVW